MSKICQCDYLAGSLVLLMFNNRDLDVEERTFTCEGNTIILKLTAELKESIEDLPEMCSLKASPPKNGK